MNPLTNVKNITKLNEIELASGLIHKKSWHDIYKSSAWIFVGGLEYGLTEGDIIAVFSQYGEIVNINLVRDKKTGKSKGYCFLCYANQKSTVLAVDNLNAIKLCNRTIRVDHVANYKPPKEDERDDEITKMVKSEGCAPKLFATNEKDITSHTNNQAKKKKTKKEKKEKKKKKRRHSSGESDSGTQNSNLPEVKKEKHDSGYDKYDTSLNKVQDNTEKQKHRERNYEQSLNERSHENIRSKFDHPHHMTSERNIMQHKDKFVDKHRSKARSEYESQHKIVQRDYASSSRTMRRERSSSSYDDSSRNPEDSVRFKPERSRAKNKHSDSRRNRKEARKSSSSSSDEDSSSQSSSDDERHKTESRNSKKNNYKSYDEKTSFHEVRRNKYDSRSEDSDHTSSKSRHYDKTERDFEYKSRNKYRSDDKYDNCHRGSSNKSKQEKRM